MEFSDWTIIRPLIYWTTKIKYGYLVTNMDHGDQKDLVDIEEKANKLTMKNLNRKEKKITNTKT